MFCASCSVQPTKTVDKFVKNWTGNPSQVAWAVAFDTLMTNQAAKYQTKSNTCDVALGFGRGLARLSKKPVGGGAFAGADPHDNLN